MMRRNLSLIILLIIIILSSCIKTTKKISDSNNSESKVLKREEIKLRDDIDYMIIEGTVISIESNEVIPFCNIIIENIDTIENPIRKIADIHGKFSFLVDIKSNYSYTFGAIGYKKLTINNIIFEKGKNIKLKIGLKTTATRLEEIKIDIKDR